MNVTYVNLLIIFSFNMYSKRVKNPFFGNFFTEFKIAKLFVSIFCIKCKGLKRAKSEEDNNRCEA